MEFWTTLDGTAKIVLVATTLSIVIGVTGFTWFLVTKSKTKK